MLKKMYIKKIMVATLALIALFLLYLMPSNTNTSNLVQENLEYVTTTNQEVIYLLDENNYVTRVTMNSEYIKSKELARDVLEGLIVDGEKSHIIPSGFRSTIPSKTEVLNLNLDNQTLTINFSKDLLEVSAKDEEKMIESIVFSLTSIKGIEKVIIQVEGNNLEKLPHSQKKLSMPLDKSFGINKKYDLTPTKGIESYTVYYVSQIDDTKYYVPVTKYINKNGTDKIKMIIDELSTSPIYETNLMSYLDANVSLIDYSFDQEKLKLNFNDAILSDKNDHILEEVIYTISLSAQNNFSIKEAIFCVNNKEIYNASSLT